MPNILGTATGNTGIPSLLISTLQQVTDQPTHDALYQIQNWANSFIPILKFNGTVPAAQIGTLPNGVTIFAAASAVETTDGSGDFSVFYPTPFPNGVLTTIISDGDNSSGQVSQMAINTSGAALNGFSARAWNPAGVPIASGSVRCNYIALGG